MAVSHFKGLSIAYGGPFEIVTGPTKGHCGTVDITATLGTAAVVTSCVMTGSQIFLAPLARSGQYPYVGVLRQTPGVGFGVYMKENAGTSEVSRGGSIFWFIVNGADKYVPEQ